jgi:hypothetical protein
VAGGFLGRAYRLGRALISGGLGAPNGSAPPVIITGPALLIATDAAVTTLITTDAPATILVATDSSYYPP